MSLVKLRALTDKFDFGNQLNTSLRDGLIVGINDTRMQRCLQAQPSRDLTLEGCGCVYCNGSSRFFERSVITRDSG